MLQFLIQVATKTFHLLLILATPVAKNGMCANASRVQNRVTRFGLHAFEESKQKKEQNICISIILLYGY